jgi:glycosyltransferase involved in cell wall biosynthesis
MNILHVAPYYAPAWAYGGVVRAVHGLATAQAASGHHVTVLTTDSLSPDTRISVQREVIDGVTVIRCHNGIGLLRRLNLSSPFGMGRQLQRLPTAPDVVHCHELRTVENLIVTAAFRRKQTPLIVSPHGTLPHDTGRTAIKRGWDRLFGRQLAYGFTGVVALTSTEADMARGWWAAVGGQQPAITVIPNGVDLPDLYLSQPVEASQMLLADFPPRAPLPGQVARADQTASLTVLFMGRLHERKGVQLLIPAFAQANIPGSRLLIVGPDEGMLATLQSLAIRCGIVDRVTFAGYLTGAERDQAYARADVFVLPAIGEGLSIAALEAMAAGLPVILTPGCNLPEAAARGAGLIVAREVAPLAEAIRALFADATRRETMGAAGRRWMNESFSWPTVAAQTIQFYQTL